MGECMGCRRVKEAPGQISILDIQTSVSVCGCGDCLCRDCLFWWSGRCPYGGCYDDHRAEVLPYDKEHPDKPARTGWSNWRKDQAYWCRGGATYPQYVCEHYRRYQGSIVMGCLKANVQKFQDGFMRCGCGDNFDCEKCYAEFMERNGE